MRCPFCRALVHETQAACSGCGLSMEGIDSLLGAAPRIESGLVDRAGILTRRDQRRVRRQLNEMHIRFPQLRFSVATLDNVPASLNLSTYTFWLFNRSDVVRQFDTEGRNYDVLLTLEPQSSRASLIVGYGLEPFVGTHHLDKVLAAGHANLVAGRFAAALLTMFDTLSTLLREVADGIPGAFALPEVPVVEPKNVAEAALQY